MNDFFGPRGPSPTPVENGTPRAVRPGTVARKEDNTPTDDRRPPDDRRAFDKNNGQHDPAVSISSSTVPVKTGDHLDAAVTSRDAAGRAVISTASFDYALLDALSDTRGLNIGDRLAIKILDVAPDITAHLISINQKNLDKPSLLRLEIVAAHSTTEEPAAPVAYGPAPLAASANIIDRSHLIAATSNNGITALIDPANALEQQLNTASNNALLAIQQPAFTTKGKSVVLTLATPAVLQLAPQQSAEILSVKPLTIDEARQYDIPAVALANPDSTPSLLATSQGTLIVPATVSPAVIGQPVLIQPISGQQGDRPPAAEPADTAQTQVFSDAGLRMLANKFPAKLRLNTTEADAALVRVTLGFPDTASSRAAGSTEGNNSAVDSRIPLGSMPISKVQIIATRPSPRGPLATHRITTAIGTAELELPAPLRPRAGDYVYIADFEEPASKPAINPEAPSASSTPLQPLPALDALNAATEHLAALANGKIQGDFPGHIMGHLIGQTEADTAYPVPHALRAAAEQALADIAAPSTDGGARLTNSLLFFIAAMGAKKTDALIGDTAARLLARAHTGAGVSGRQGPNMLDGVLREIGQLFQAARPDRPSGEWRGFTLPFEVRDAHVLPLHLVVRDIGDDDDHQSTADHGPEQPERRQQFVVAVDFSVLGPMQLHGMIDGKRFNLTMASHVSLTPGLEAELTALFSSALAANGFAGHLIFAGRNAFMDIGAYLAAESS